jgi:hypothetical protein
MRASHIENLKLYLKFSRGWCLSDLATSACGLKLLVHEALSY